MIGCRLLLILSLFTLCSVAQAQMVHDMVDTLVSLSEPQVEQAGKNAYVHLTSNEIDIPFTGVALQGLTSADTLTGFVRFEENGAWSEWLPLYIVTSATDNGFLAAYRSDVVRERQLFALRFTVGASDSLKLLAAGVFDNRKDVAAPRSDGQPPQEAHNFVIVPPTLLGRTVWRAEPFRGTPIALNRPNYTDITLHHTAGFSATTQVEGLEQVRRIQDFHQNGRGWSDIGYQFLMDQEGRLYQGRPFINNRIAFADGPPLAQGAHVGGHNRGNIGVSLMGCYHPAEGSHCTDTMTAEASDSLLVMFAYLSERYGVSPTVIGGHRDFSATSCPGDNNYTMLPSLRTGTATLLQTGNVQLGNATLLATADEIGVVTLSWTFLQDNGIASFAIERTTDAGSTIVVERESVANDSFVDTGATTTGNTTYTLHAYGNRGRTQILGEAGVTIIPRENSVLTQNFPNPFSSTTTIRYFLQQSGIVHLRVYDVTGRQVSSLEEDWREKEQWHTTIFDASGLPGGIYFYEMRVEGFADIIHQVSQPLVVLQ